MQVLKVITKKSVREIVPELRTKYFYTAADFKPGQMIELVEGKKSPAIVVQIMTMEKLKQIATLKLIGAPDKTIVGLIVQQSLALGLVGWSFGLVLILLVKDVFPRRVVLEPVNAAALGGIIIVVCIFASGLGVRAALKVDPATAIGG